MKCLTHPSHIKILNHDHIILFRQLMTQLVVKILSLAADLFMSFCQTYFLFLIVMAAYFASAEFSLLSCKFLFSFSDRKSVV